MNQRTENNANRHLGPEELIQLSDGELAELLDVSVADVTRALDRFNQIVSAPNLSSARKAEVLNIGTDVEGKLVIGEAFAKAMVDLGRVDHLGSITCVPGIAVNRLASIVRGLNSEKVSDILVRLGTEPDEFTDPDDGDMPDGEDTDSVDTPPINPFVTLPPEDKVQFRPYIAAALGERINRPLTNAERLLSTRIAQSANAKAVALFMIEAILADEAAARALEAEDVELFEAISDAGDNIDIGTAAPEADEDRRPRARSNRGINGHVEPDQLIAFATPFALLQGDVFGDIGDVTDPIKPIGDALKGGADLLKEGRRSLKEIRDALKGRRPGSTATPGKSDDETQAGSETSKSPNFIQEDEYGKRYREALDTEDIYSVWLDAVCNLENEGPGDENIYWLGQSKIYMRDNALITSVVFSQEYGIDEFEEIRLSPTVTNPARPGRFSKRIRTPIRVQDAILAIGRGTEIFEIPLSKLDHIDIFFDLYESDRIFQAADETVEAFVTAALTGLTFVRGKLTPGSVGQVKAANRSAIKKLFDLINSDETLMSEYFRIDADQLRQAFASKESTIFDVPNRKTKAAVGLSEQRRVAAIHESSLFRNSRRFDTSGADAHDTRRAADLRRNPRQFFEDHYDSYYEIRLRYEKREKKKQP